MKPLAVAAISALVAAVSSATASDRTALVQATNALRSEPAYVDPALAGLVRRERLAYPARVATRAADGRRVVVAFVSVPDIGLDSFRERLYARLGLRGVDGTLIVATPTSITMRTPNLTPDAELAIIRRDGAAIELPSRPYTEVLAELVYDTGLVVHNTTPEATPRGAGRDRNLATFSGHFAGESRSGWWPLVLIPAVAAIALAVAVGIGIRRRSSAR
jgi:hypothetical protein